MRVRPRRRVFHTRASIPLIDRMTRVLPPLSPLKRRFELVGSLFPTLLADCRFSSSVALPHSDSPQSLHFSGIAQSVLSGLDKECGKAKNFDHGVAYKDLILEISDLVPELARRFRRVSELKPQDVLELLVGFESECGKVGFRAIKVESLWGLFKWANGQHEGFNHLPRSYEVMARVLVRFGFFREVELLLLEMDSQGVRLGCGEILGNMIEGYVGCGDLNRAVSMYDRMRRRGFAPSLWCYRVFLGRLVQVRKTQVAFRVCMDMVEMSVGSDEATKTVLDRVIGLLCADRKIQEARNLVRKAMAFGFEVSDLDINDIVYGYCEKRDFDDAISFFREIKSVPNILAGNRIISSVCRYLGSENAQFYVEELEGLGFVPDEVTFGILIGWCCREGKMRSSFAYLEEIFSRGMKPHINSFNALISGLFVKGMWRHAWHVFDELVEKGITPDLSTFRILLAGYCRGRNFNEVKKTVSEMEIRGLVETAMPESRISQAFTVLGFDPLSVRLKRNNELDSLKPDFYDDLGNGLHLDTDLTEYEIRVTQVIDSNLVVDYNSLIMKKCIDNNMKASMDLADEMVRWGQELSLPAFTSLLKVLCSTCSPIEVYANVLERNMKLFNLLDQEALNLLVRVYCMRGWTYNGKLVLDNMYRRHLKIDDETYVAVITGLCKTRYQIEFRYWWDIARRERWVPRPENSKALLQCLCGKGMVEESLELLEIMLVSNTCSSLEICHLFLEQFSCTSLSRVSHVLLEELIRRGCIVDRLAYSHVLSGMCKDREFSAALKLLSHLLSQNVAPSLGVTVSLIPRLCIANRHEVAISLKEISLRENPNSSIFVYNALVKGLCTSTKIGEAIAVLQEMQLKGIIPNAETYGVLVDGFCKISDLAKVKELLGFMLRREIELSIPNYRNLVRLMLNKAKIGLALNLKELMLRQSDCHDLIAYNILIFQLFSTGNSLLVNEVLGDLQHNLLRLDEVSYNFLVYGFMKCGDLSSGLKYLSTMISEELRPSNRSLRSVMTALCDSRELEKASSLSREMELRGWPHDSSAQNSIVESLISIGELDEAEKFLDRVAEKKLIPGNINYDNLIKCFCSCGRPNKALDLINTMLKNGVVPSSTSYDSVIISCCALNNMSGAMEFETEMLDRGLRPRMSTWATLVHRLCQDGRAAEAEEVLVSMASVGETPTRDMFTSVIKRYQSENRPQKATEVVEMMQRSGYELDFETHWSVIGSLRKSYGEAGDNAAKGFLSRLLYRSGFLEENEAKTKSFLP